MEINFISVYLQQSSILYLCIQQQIAENLKL